MLKFTTPAAAQSHFSIQEVKNMNEAAGCFQFSSNTLRHFGQTLRDFKVWTVTVDHEGKQAGLVFLFEKHQADFEGKRRFVGLVRQMRKNGSFTTPLQVESERVSVDGKTDFNRLLPKLLKAKSFAELDDFKTINVDGNHICFEIKEEKDQTLQDFKITLENLCGTHHETKQFHTIIEARHYAAEQAKAYGCTHWEVEKVGK